MTPDDIVYLQFNLKDCGPLFPEGCHPSGCEEVVPIEGETPLDPAPMWKIVSAEQYKAELHKWQFVLIALLQEKIKKMDDPLISPAIIDPDTAKKYLSTLVFTDYDTFYDDLEAAMAGMSFKKSGTYLHDILDALKNRKNSEENLDG